MGPTKIENMVATEGPQLLDRTLYHCDNLVVLQGINSNTVDLIATDPPFNKSKDFHAAENSAADGGKFTDRWSWNKDVHPKWVDDLKDDWPGVWASIMSAQQIAGKDMAAFLCWLSVRLIPCHRILKDTGSIYLHIDYTAHAYVKCLMDGIFGKENFRNEIVWQRAYGGKTSQFAPKKFGSNHDTLLFYTKSENYTLNAYSELDKDKIETLFPLHTTPNLSLIHI